MGRSMYNFGKHSKEKARQQKQLEKAAKRMRAKQQSTIKPSTPSENSEISEPKPGEDIVKSMA